MKFLIVTNHSYMLWRFRKEVIEQLLTRGEVVISTPFVGHEDDFKKLGCKLLETNVDRRGINPLKDLKLYKTYKSILKSEKPDVVITYSIKPNIYMGYACCRCGIKYFVNVQGLGTAFQKKPVATIATIMYRIGVKRAQRVFFENEANAEEFVKRKIVKREKQVVLNGAGINLDEFMVVDYPPEENGVRFLFLGRIMKEKGIDELFEAAKIIKAKYGNKAHFDLVGFFEDEYKETVEKLNEDGIINYYGFQSDPKPYYEQAHCVILPSYHEGMSNVLLEGAATGRALITSNIPGCKEAVENGVTGFLCEKKSTNSLVEYIEKFLNLSENERKEMGCLGRERIEKLFDKKQIVDKVITEIMG